MNTFTIASSILASDFSKLGKEISDVIEAGSDWVHFDVMDGHFVPNISFGPSIIKSVRRYTKCTFDCHLMIEPCDYYLEAFAESGCDLITIHAEATKHLDRSLQMISDLGKRVGVALNPSTPEAMLDYVLDRINLVLLMSVNPGFGGQKFIKSTLEKTKRVREMIGSRQIDIQIDGGITSKNARLFVEAGASVLVAGSEIFKGGNKSAYKKNIQEIRNIVA